MVESLPPIPPRYRSNPWGSPLTAEEQPGKVCADPSGDKAFAALGQPFAAPAAGALVGEARYVDALGDYYALNWCIARIAGVERDRGPVFPNLEKPGTKGLSYHGGGTDASSRRREARTSRVLQKVALMPLPQP